MTAKVVPVMAAALAAVNRNIEFSLRLHPAA